MRTLIGHRKPVQGVAWSRDGRWIVSGGGGLRGRGELILWNAQTGKQVREFDAVPHPVESVAFDPEGGRVLAGLADQALLIRFQDGKKIKSSRGAVKVWSVRTGKELLALRVKSKTNTQEAISSVAFSPDEKLIAAGRLGERSAVYLWDADTGKPVREHEDLHGPVTSVCFSPDGQYLMATTENPLIHIWSVSSGRLVQTLRGHTLMVHAAVFSPDGRWIASGSLDHQWKLWDFAAILRSSSAKVTAPPATATNPKGTLIAQCADRVVILRERRTGARLRELKGHRQPTTSVTFSRDGKWLASGDKKGTIRIWNSHSGKLIWSMKGHAHEISDLAFSPGGSRLASVSHDKVARVWDLHQWKCVCTFDKHKHWIKSIDFSPDGKLIVTGGGANVQLLLGKRLGTTHPHLGEVHVWDAQSGEESIQLPKHKYRVVDASFSLDGKWIVSGSGVFGPLDRALVRMEMGGPLHRKIGLGEIHVCDARTGRHVHTFSGHYGEIRRCSFAPDGRLATTDDQGTMKLWDLSTGVEVYSGVGPSRDAHLDSFDWHQSEAVKAEKNKEWFAAAFHFQQLIRLRPWNVDYQVRRAYALRKQESWKEATKQYMQTLLLRPTRSLWPLDSKASRRGETAAKQRDWALAASEYEIAIRQPSASDRDWGSLMLCQIAAGQTEAYRRTTREWVSRVEKSRNARSRSSLLHYGSLMPCDSVLARRLLMIAFKPKRRRSAATLDRLGMAWYRVGHFQLAEENFRQSLKAHSRGGYLNTKLALAQTVHRLGRKESARKLLREVETWYEQNRSLIRTWRDRILWELWLKEARETLAKPPVMPRARSSR